MLPTFTLVGASQLGRACVVKLAVAAGEVAVAVPVQLLTTLTV